MGRGLINKNKIKQKTKASKTWLLCILHIMQHYLKLFFLFFHQQQLIINLNFTNKVWMMND